MRYKLLFLPHHGTGGRMSASEQQKGMAPLGRITSESPLEERTSSPAVGPLDIPTIRTEYVIPQQRSNGRATRQKGLGDVCEYLLH